MDSNQVTERLQTSGGLVKTAVLITVDQDRAIDRLAAERSTSRSAVLRQLIARGLKVEAAVELAAEAVA